MIRHTKVSGSTYFSSEVGPTSARAVTQGVGASRSANVNGSPLIAHIRHLELSYFKDDVDTLVKTEKGM